MEWITRRWRQGRCWVWAKYYGKFSLVVQNWYLVALVCQEALGTVGQVVVRSHLEILPRCNQRVWESARSTWWAHISPHCGEFLVQVIVSTLCMRTSLFSLHCMWLECCDWQQVVYVDTPLGEGTLEKIYSMLCDISRRPRCEVQLGAQWLPHLFTPSQCQNSLFVKLFGIICIRRIPYKTKVYSFLCYVFGVLHLSAFICSMRESERSTLINANGHQAPVVCLVAVERGSQVCK